MVIEYNTLEKLDQKLIILLSCFALGAAKQTIHTEEIAYKAFLLKKSGFSWQIEKYQKYPDLTKVRKALDRAKDLGWIIGSYSYDLFKDGWKLTTSGINAANEIKHLLKIKKTKIMLQPIDKKKLKIFSNNTYYQKFIKNNNLEINSFELADMLGSAAGNSQNIRSKFFELKNLVLLGENEKLSLFLEHLEKKFPDLLNINELHKNNMASNRKISNIK
ncbi:hypothetical protein N9S95_00950 [Candidatus Pelagibacter sp.]|nr:hypothetical protein [Candidatus Pelagibacter sp.]